MTGIMAFNRALPIDPPADGWVHAVPFGEFPGWMRHSDGRKERGILVCNAESFNRVIQDFEQRRTAPGFEGLLLDRDHLSHKDAGSTEAMGYIKDMAVRGDGADTLNDGLWLRIEFTKPGEEAVRGRVYRRISVASHHKKLDGNRWGFDSISDAALTNKPNLPVQAISLNRAPVWEQDTEKAPASANAQELGTGEKNMDYKAMLLALFGLPADASDDAIQAKHAEMTAQAQSRETELAGAKQELTETKSKLATSENRVKELETGALKVEAEAFITKHADRIKPEDRPKVLNSYIASKDLTISIFESLATQPARAAKALNDGKDPTGTDADKGKDKDQPTGVARTAKALAASKK